MHTCTPQESGIERLAEKKALNRKRQAFIRIYEDAWSTQFQQRAVPISVLSNLKAFSSNEELAALSESEWQSCVAQWLADDRMARKRWPISHLIAGITTDYAPDLSVPCDDAEEGSDSTEAPTNSELDHLVAQGWLPYDRWREWPLFSEAPLLAKMLFSARWAWNGCEGVWPPIGARFSDEGLTIVTQGTDCGYWALEVVDALVHAAENAGHPLVAIVAGDRNYTWWTAPERQTA